MVHSAVDVFSWCQCGKNVPAYAGATHTTVGAQLQQRGVGRFQWLHMSESAAPLSAMYRPPISWAVAAHERSSADGRSRDEMRREDWRLTTVQLCHAHDKLIIVFADYAIALI